VTADRVAISGTLLVSPDGMDGFLTDLDNPNVELTNLRLNASGIPGTIINMIDMLRLQGVIQSVIAKGAELAMKPMMNTVLGALAGPKQLDVLGKTMTMEVHPTELTFAPDGALVTMDMKMLLAGAEAATFVYTENGMPAMDAGDGFQLGLADDLANEMMSEAHALGMLDLAMPTVGGTFNRISIKMGMAPMISADPTDGTMKVMLGDAIATFMQDETPMGRAAINASIDVKIESAGNGYNVAIKLGEPKIKFTMMNDIENLTRLEDADLARSAEVCLTAQINTLSKLLVNIPLPALAGLHMRNLTVGSDMGYVMVKGALE
jgi:hypothetical protein